MRKRRCGRKRRLERRRNFCPLLPPQCRPSRATSKMLRSRQKTDLLRYADEKNRTEKVNKISSNCLLSDQSAEKCPRRAIMEPASVGAVTARHARQELDIKRRSAGDLTKEIETLPLWGKIRCQRMRNANLPPVEPIITVSSFSLAARDEKLGSTEGDLWRDPDLWYRRWVTRPNARPR